MVMGTQVQILVLLLAGSPPLSYLTFLSSSFQLGKQKKKKSTEPVLQTNKSTNKWASANFPGLLGR